MKLFVCVAAAAMTLASCQKNEIAGPVNKEVHFTIKADAPQTKTSIADKGDKTYTPSWTKGDKIGVFFAKPTGNGIDKEFENVSDEPLTALFTGTHSFTANEDGLVDGYLYAFYPSEAFNKTYSDGDIRLDLSANQKPTSTSFDPDCDLLVAAPCYFVAEATGEQANVEIDDLYFARLMAVLRINLNSEFLSGEVVKSVSFKADDQKLCGGIRINPETAEVEEYVSTGDLSTITATYSEDDPIAVAGQKNSAYLVIAPVTIPENTSLTFTIETENYDIVKTVTSPKMTLSAGNVNVINLTIEEENCEEKVEDTSDYSGSYIIVAKKDSDNTYYYMSTLRNGVVNGNNRTAISSGVSEITDYTASKTDFPDVDETCVWNVSATEGGYILSNIDNSAYLYTENDNRAYMGAADQASVFAISVEENVYTVTATEYSRVLSFNTSSNLFACYSSGQNPALVLIPYVPDTTPRINVEKNEYTADAAATSLNFTYTTKNITGNVTATVKANPTMKDVSAVAEDGTVTVNFAVNTETSEKTATIVLSYEGAQDVNVVITQEAAGATKQYYVKVTSAPTDWSGTYLIVFDDNKAHATVSGKDFNATSNALTISNGKIEATDDLSSAAVTISKKDSGYSILLPSGLYLKVSSASTISSSSAVANYLSFVNNTTQSGSIRISGDSNFNTSSYILYHQSIYFRCYTNKLTTTNYKLPDLYKLEEGGGQTPDPEEPETPAYPENSYVKYSGALVEGDYIIVYDGKAMKNTVSSSRLEYSEVSPTNDYIVAPDASIVWHLAQNGDYWTIYNANANKYAASTGAKNKAQLLESGTDDQSLWTASGSDTYDFENKKNKSNGVNANLRNNGTYGFACYATGTGGALTLYKKN